MKLVSVTEVWNVALTLVKEMNKDELVEAEQFTVRAAPVLKQRAKRLKKQIEELVEAGGSRRDVLAFVPLSWREAGISFPKNSKECEQVAQAYGIMYSFAWRKVLGTSPRELKPLIVEAFRRKQDTFDEFAGIIDKYWLPAGEWFCRHINHGAAALADFYFGKLRPGGIPLVELVTLILEQAGLEGAKKAIDKAVKAEDSQYCTFMNAYGELVDALTAGTDRPSPSAAAELIVASWERMIRHEATFYKDLTQRGSKLRRAVIEGIASSMRESCRKRLTELEAFFGVIECRNEFRRSEIDFESNKALALDIILTYKRWKAGAKRRREAYKSLGVLCEEAGADYKFVEAFGVERRLLPKRGRPKK